MRVFFSLFFISSLVVVGGLFLFFNVQLSLTGMVVENQTSDYSSNNVSVIKNISRVEAVLAINQSQLILAELESEGFPVEYVKDSILESNLALDRADYAEALRNASSSERDRELARQYLKLLDWKNISYNDVLVFTDNINSRRDLSFELYDKLNAVKINLDKFNNLDTSIELSLFNQANNSFYSEKFEECLSLLNQIESSVERRSSELGVLSGLRENTLTFLVRFWKAIFVIALFVVSLFIVFYHSLSKKILKKKIAGLISERKAIQNLMKRSQEERFKENKISQLVYNIRMNKYSERLQDIKQELPILESKLKK